MRRLQRRVNSNGMITIKDSKSHRAAGLKKFLSAINRKRIPLCKENYQKFEKNERFLVDKSYLNKVVDRNNDKQPFRFLDNLDVAFKGKSFKIISY